ncbi:hypothetical protein EAH75_08795 [Rhodanobacter glycinis]|uniref:Uncharacterized protein n=1 Tax=Rhodanobacter glycinis TaxID=582702 RepID=A0A502FGH8_9GAMM|nr:hypothetical protein [Rhodanobacter glycinis]TPG11049.1 hypothetical protein EAH88_00365 [Rhodanobacter glycinis]TPG48538.1 hypothetical protein EAH75_08795 [Rhodanobacter glycinis]
MSDFLDRLAARAIGSETALVPRMPSLFEPLQRTSIMPASDDGEAVPRHRETVSAATVTPTTAPTRLPQAPVVAMTDAPHVAPAEPVAAPPHAVADMPRAAVQPAPIAAAAPTPSPVIGRPVASSTLLRPAEVSAPLPVRPRQTRIAAEPTETVVPSQPSSGALLPAPTPVFGAAAAPARSSNAAAFRPLAVQAGAGSSSGEPVVHVSIGRLEVRAAPASTTPPRRRDAPQPSSLDDYLRQRGKASS